MKVRVMRERMVLTTRVFALWVLAFFLAGSLLGFGVALQWIAPRLTATQWEGVRGFADWRPTTEP